jgi:aspartokinase
MPACAVLVEKFGGASVTSQEQVKHNAIVVVVVVVVVIVLGEAMQLGVRASPRLYDNLDYDNDNDNDNDATSIP